MNLTRWITIFCILFTLCCHIADGQDATATLDSAQRATIALKLGHGVVRGKILDEFGRPLELISITDVKTKYHAITNKEGEFSMPAREPGKLLITGVSVMDKKVDYNPMEYVTVKMKYKQSALDSVTVGTVKEKKDPTRFIELTNRNYMNLGQILQGTVPGLSLQIASANKVQVNSIDVFTHYQPGTSNNIDTYETMTVDDFLSTYGTTNGQTIINNLLQNPNAYSSNGYPKYRLHTSTVVTNTLVPQIRGVNNFSGNASSMLVVIDGFPQDNFPADFPMSNVESVEVIKDPKELIKWGPSAAGGVILIKTKTGKKGTLKVDYTANFYYSPAPQYSQNKLLLASSADYLDYKKDFGQTYDPSSFNLTPAQRLLSQKAHNQITDAQFNTSWDSLGQIDNEGQIRLLLQNAFSQNHSLSLTGGTQWYRFALIGNYFSSSTNQLNGSSQTQALNLNNHFNLLDGRLRINWLLKYSHGNTRTGYSFDPNNSLEPYQLLLDPNGNYVYDYSDLSPAANATIVARGYQNYGVNILQDARVNKNTSKLSQMQTNYNMEWDLLPGLRWNTSVYYNGQNTTTENFYDKQSSYVRQLVDRYGAVEKAGINFYVPYGNILNRSKRTAEQWNVRTALSYTQSIGRSQFSASLGGGAASTISRQPATATIYGYNTTTKNGVPIYLPTPDPTASISNFYKLINGSSTAIPYTLTIPGNGDTTRSRNVNWNAALGYRYGDRLFVSGAYSSVFNPVYGQNATYSVLSNYNADATGLLLKNRHPHKAFSRLSLSVGMAGMKMPDLPIAYTNSRYLQTTWDNYTIWVDGLSPTQQKGQRTTNLYQKLTLDMFDSSLSVHVAYNTMNIHGSTASFSNLEAEGDTSYTQKYVSAGIQGRMRRGRLSFGANYSKSPEGQSQVNGTGMYDIAHEDYFHSKKISTLRIEGLIESISPYQAMGLMMSTNDVSGGSFGLATNNTFSTLPPKNTNWEVHFALGIRDDANLFDLRYYNHTTSGLNNNVAVYTDPSTGLSNQITYSSINNKGIEFFLKNKIVKTRDFNYVVTLNGAYNVNIARSVPVTAFSATGNYPTAYRSGYNTSNIWSFKWAGLNDQGDPQVYTPNGKAASTMDSATLAGAMVYSGVTNAPWTGGFIHELSYKQFFARIALTFQWDYVMRRYIPAMNNDAERSVLIKDRWKTAGDEKNTDIARIVTDGGNTYRSFVIQNSSNSILSADNIRLQEVMVGWTPPLPAIRKLGLASMTLTLQVQNAAVWTKNKLHIDPSTVGANGKLGLPVPRQYSCTLNVGF